MNIEAEEEFLLLCKAAAPPIGGQDSGREFREVYRMGGEGIEVERREIHRTSFKIGINYVYLKNLATLDLFFCHSELIVLCCIIGLYSTLSGPLARRSEQGISI